MDLLEGIEVCHTNLSGRKSNNWAILFMESINVEHALAGYDSAFQAIMCEASVRRPGKVSCRARETDMDKLSMRVVDSVCEGFGNPIP